MEETTNSYEAFLSEKSLSRSITVFDKLTMSLVQTTIASAESGNLGDFYELCEYIEASDTRLRGMIGNRRKAVSKRPFAVQSANLDDERANEAADLVMRNITKLKWKSFIRELMDGRIYGVQVNQKIWGKDENGNLCITSLVGVDRSKIQQANWGASLKNPNFTFGELLISKYRYGTETIPVAELLEENSVIVAVDKDDKGKYDLHGIMRGVLRWYIVKLFTLQSWSQYAEKYGFPITTATTSEAMFNKNSALMKRLLSSVGSNRYGVFLEGMDVKIANGASTANIDVFERLLANCNNEIAIGLLGQNLTTDVSGGSFAAAKVHLDVLDAIIEDDAEFIDEIVNDQFVKPLVALNFPDLPIEDYPTYFTVFEKQVNVSEIARGLKDAASIVPIPVSHIYERLNIPEPLDDEQTIGGYNGNSLLDAISGAS